MNDKNVKNTIKNGIEKGDGRIKPGEIRNPNGRPRTEDTISDCIREYLAGEVATESGEKLTRAQIAARAMYKSALNGNSAMMNIMLDRAYGKCKENYDINIARKNPFEDMSIDEVRAYIASRRNT